MTATPPADRRPRTSLVFDPTVAPPPPPPPPRGFRRILHLAWPERWTLAFGTFFLLLGSVMGLAAPKLIGGLVDGMVEGGGTAAIDRAVVVLVGVFVVMGVATALRAYLFTVAGERVVADLRTALYRSVIHQEVGFFDGERTGDLTNRLSADTTVLQNAVTVNISMALRFTVTILGTVIILVWMNWKLTLAMLSIVPVVAVGAALFGRMLRKLSKQVQDALATSTSVAEETIAGIRTVRAFAQEGLEDARYTEAVDESFRLARKRAVLYAGFTGLITFFGFGVIAAVLWLGGRMVVGGEISFGDLVSFLLYTFTMAMSLSGLAALYADFAKAIGASERVFELLDREPEVAGGARTLARVAGEVSLEGVGFRYPTRPDVPVLTELNLVLRPGEVVALVGPSGGGKSTVAQLLSRFYDPDQGALVLDGVPFTDLDPDWLRRQVGVVSQEPLLFATSVRDNIRYARPEASAEEVEAAARAANAHDFISEFPEGYETLVGERGVRLSGGQKQRVAIARAVLKDPRVLVLDEATSALDAESEHLVQEALDRLMEGRTTLVIAHRLSTVRDANRVVVLDGGRVVEEGSHEELLALDGLYKKLVERQFAA